MNAYTGKIIVLAYPDTFVKMSTERICKVLPWVGLGTKNYIKAGHAALVLIENNSGKAHYYDFGRYVTPSGLGRVRSSSTDAELEIPFRAHMNANGELLNLDEFLLWLERNPQKTHGFGRLLASICDAIDFQKAASYVKELQSRGSIPYGAFDKNGSNCSRFVTETLLAATDNKKIKQALKFNKIFTPSTVGNVEKAASDFVYEVLDGTIKKFTGSALHENLTNYFDTKVKLPASIMNQKADGCKNLQKLSGIGSSAYFEIVEKLSFSHYRIKRYNEWFEVDFDGVFISEEFDSQLDHTFTYDSHCKYCHVIQKERKIRFDFVALFSAFNLMQKAQTA